jgi:hypothetical protein
VAAWRKKLGRRTKNEKMEKKKSLRFKEKGKQGDKGERDTKKS